MQVSFRSRRAPSTARCLWRRRRSLGCRQRAGERDRRRLPAHECRSIGGRLAGRWADKDTIPSAARYNRLNEKLAGTPAGEKHLQGPARGRLNATSPRFFVPRLSLFRPPCRRPHFKRHRRLLHLPGTCQELSQVVLLAVHYDGGINLRRSLDASSSRGFTGKISNRKER